jgi:hypothetical protein
MPDVTYACKEYFLDRAAVLARAGKMRARALGMGGAYIRRKARDLLRKGKKPAQPGKPPKTHGSEPNVRTILFAMDPATDTMLIGPVKLNSAKRLRASNRLTVPELLEQGGTAEVDQYSPDGQEWMTLDLAVKYRKRKKFRGPFQRRKKAAKYSAHPFMAPALAEALPKIPEHFRDLL